MLNGAFKYRTGIAKKAGVFQSADTAPDDGLFASVVPMHSAKNLATVTADDYLSKDMVAALLLNLLGAKDGDIIANYEVTFSYLFSDTSFDTSNLPLNLANSNRENLIVFLKKLKTDYGNAYNYLIECGLTEIQLDKIKELFIR